MAKLPIYLDCNATTPVDPAVYAAMKPYLESEFGNAGSRTHEYGSRAARAVQSAREAVASVVGAEARDVVFTSGATESNNLALLGLAQHAEKIGKRHVITTAIEHKAVLEPFEELQARGFDVSIIRSDRSGAISAEAVAGELRDDTLLVSVMHVNNETGVIQPLNDIAQLLNDHGAYLHTDAAQGFGKEFETLKNPRIDLISISGHKIYGTKGIGALILKRRSGQRPPLRPLTWGGGQERGLRPGTLPVPLIVGLGAAAKEALVNREQRRQRCREIREAIIRNLQPVGLEFFGDPELTLPHVLNLAFDDIDSEAIILALKDIVAISNGSACTSTTIEPSHVILAMGYTEAEAHAATRWSWSHFSPDPDWTAVKERIQTLR